MFVCISPYVYKTSAPNNTIIIFVIYILNEIVSSIRKGFRYYCSSVNWVHSRLMQGRGGHI